MDNRKISLCIPTYNRFLYTVEAFKNVLEDPRVSEIILSDDASTDDSYERLQRGFAHRPKVKLFRNEKNLDCYLNKREAIRHATNEWCILLDSDNVIDKSYIDKLYQYEWETNIAYQPSFAKPHFDYRRFSHDRIHEYNVAKKLSENNGLDTALNTMNYFVNREEFLLCFDDREVPHTADSIFMNYNWLHSGNEILIVEGLEYEHRVHEGSHYLNNNHLTGNFYNEVVDKLKKLK